MNGKRRMGSVVGLKDDVTSGVAAVLDATWDIRKGTVVPTTEGVKLGNGAVLLTANYLYADLANSSQIAQTYHATVAGKIIRSYLNAAVRVIKHYDGEIRSFDGDRVMGIFVGDRRNTRSVEAALALTWAVENVMNPKFKARWPTGGDGPTFGAPITHGVGIASGEAMIVRGGVRNSNDLVSIGAAPNIGAKFSNIRKAGYSTFITKDVYDTMMNPLKVAGKWLTLSAETIGGKSYVPYATGWAREPS
jgi:adenylate cyclase